MTFHFNYLQKPLVAKVLPHLRKNGMHFEVNISGYPRFYLHWGALGRYELAPPGSMSLDDELILLVSDLIEKQTKPASYLQKQNG